MQLCPISREDHTRSAQGKLCEAARKGYDTVLEEWLHAAPQAAEKLGSLLCTAAGNGQLRIVKLLLAHMADVHYKAEKGRDSLHEACLWGGGIEVVTLLLEHKAETTRTAPQSRKSKEQLTALQMAEANNNPALAQTILRWQRGALSDEEDCIRSTLLTSTSCANISNHEARTEQLYTYEHVRQAARKDDLETVRKYLCTSPTQVDLGRHLRTAASYGSRDVVALLLDHHADPSHMGSCGRDSLQDACFYGCDGGEEVISLLLQHRADANRVGSCHGRKMTALQLIRRRPRPLIFFIVEICMITDH